MTTKDALFHLYIKSPEFWTKNILPLDYKTMTSEGCSGWTASLDYDFSLGGKKGSCLTLRCEQFSKRDCKLLKEG